MSLADDIVAATVQTFRDNLYADPDDDTMVVFFKDSAEGTIDCWVPTEAVARAATVAVLDALSTAGLTMFRNGGFGDREEIGELATAVENGRQAGEDSDD